MCNIRKIKWSLSGRIIIVRRYFIDDKDIRIALI